MATHKAGSRVPNDRPENYVFDGAVKMMNPFNIGIDPGYDAENLKEGGDVDPKPQTIKLPTDPRAKRR